MFDWDDIVKLAPAAVLMLWGVVKWARRVQRQAADMPGPQGDEAFTASESKRDEVSFERDYEPLEPR